MGKTNKRGIKRNKEKYEVKNNSNNNDEKIVIKWEDLVEIYKENAEFLINSNARFNNIKNEFKDIIENNEEIKKAVEGLKNMINSYMTELINVYELHSKEVEINKDDKVKKIRVPYMGKVNIEDTKHQDFYMYVIMSYNNLVEKMQTTLLITFITLLGMIEENAVDNIDEITSKTKKFIEDTKGE